MSGIFKPELTSFVALNGCIVVHRKVSSARNMKHWIWTPRRNKWSHGCVLKSHWPSTFRIQECCFRERAISQLQTYFCSDEEAFFKKDLTRSICRINMTCLFNTKIVSEDTILKRDVSVIDWYCTSYDTRIILKYGIRNYHVTVIRPQWVSIVSGILQNTTGFWWCIRDCDNW